jgi:hypothetical protein
MVDYFSKDIMAVVRVMNVTIPSYIKAILGNSGNGRVFIDTMSNHKSLSGGFLTNLFVR